MCQCIWTRVVWLFGQLIGPCSRNNFVANLLTVLPVLPASWSTCFIVAFIKRSTDKTRTFIFLLNALDNARSACLLSSPALCRPANGHAPMDTPRGLWTRRCCTCRCGRRWRNDGICTTICKYTWSVSPFPLPHAPGKLLEQLMVCLCLPVTHNGRKLKLLRQKMVGKSEINYFLCI